MDQFALLGNKKPFFLFFIFFKNPVEHNKNSFELTLYNFLKTAKITTKNIALKQSDLSILTWNLNKKLSKWGIMLTCKFFRIRTFEHWTHDTGISGQ